MVKLNYQQPEIIHRNIVNSPVHPGRDCYTLVLQNEYPFILRLQHCFAFKDVKHHIEGVGMFFDMLAWFQVQMNNFCAGMVCHDMAIEVEGYFGCVVKPGDVHDEGVTGGLFRFRLRVLFHIRKPVTSMVRVVIPISGTYKM